MKKTNNDDFTFLSLKPFSQTKYREIPIRVKRVIQTGPKTQFGGVKVGFCMVSYQVEIDGVVNKEPMMPAD